MTVYMACYLLGIVGTMDLLLRLGNIFSGPKIEIFVPSSNNGACEARDVPSG
jgi:hypothetical protein